MALASTPLDKTPLVVRARRAAGAAARAVPGGSRLLRLRRQALAAAQRRVRPLRPPLDTPERVRRLSIVPDDEAFITGNGFAARCRYVLNFDLLAVNEQISNNWWFCQAVFLEHFFAEHAPDEEFVLFSHNGDRSIDRRLRRFLKRKHLLAWFAVNADLRHPKLSAIPIGIANPRWPHGDRATLRKVQEDKLPKKRLFDASYDVGTYPSARLRCLEQTGIHPEPRRPFEDYLRAMASALFCISPRGNGIDTHRTWEALYLRTIPVVTRSVLTDSHPELPMIVLEDWSDFRSIDFSPDLYETTWGPWDPEALRLDRYLERVEATIARLRAAARAGAA